MSQLESRQFDRRKALRLFAAAGAVGVSAPILTACTGGAESDDNETSLGNDGSPIKVGMIVPQSGLFKPYGDDMANGFQLFLKLNGNKLGGHPVELVTADEGDKPDDMVAAIDKLVKQDKVIALTGVVNPATITAIRDKVEGSQVPLIGSNASPPTLSGAKYIWRTSFAAPEPAQALGKWVADNAGGSVAVIGGDYAGEDFEINAFLDAFRGAGGRVEGQVILTQPNSSNFGAALNTVKTSPANAMFCSFSGAQGTEFVKQYKATNFRDSFKVFSPGSLTEGYALKQQGEAARNIYTAMIYSPDLDNAANRKFLGEYQKAYAALPSTYAMTSYDAGTVLNKAISSIREELTNLSLNAAIGRLGQIDSPRGSWQFNQNRTPLQRWYLRQVKSDGTTLSNVLTAELTTLG